MEQNFINLEWDSAQFGFNVACILPDGLDKTGLPEILESLRKCRYRLAYLQIPSNRQEMANIARSLGGYLADEKVTYVKNLADELDFERYYSSSIVPYTETKPVAALKNLALQSAEYSRFRLDPNFPRELCDKLFEVWITRSVNKEIAWMILTAMENSTPVGMITLGIKEGRGEIGLLAVDVKARGKGIGRALVENANRKFAQEGYTESQVITQRKNSVACRLYETCGYKSDKIDNVFHFWL